MHCACTYHLTNEFIIFSWFHRIFVFVFYIGLAAIHTPPTSHLNVIESTGAEDWQEG